MHLNTVLIAVSWAMIDPEEGKKEYNLARPSVSRLSLSIGAATADELVPPALEEHEAAESSLRRSHLEPP